MGAAPHSRVNLASDRMRPKLSPAAMRRAPTKLGPTPLISRSAGHRETTELTVDARSSSSK